MSLDSTPSGDNSNSFCDVASADTYHSERLHNDEWDNASVSDKEAALIQSTILLNELDWYGDIAKDSTQALRFPRENLFDKDGRELTGIPAFLVNATSELALSTIREEYLAPAISASQKRVRAGSVEVEYFKETPMGGSIPSRVMDMVHPYTSGGVNNVKIERS